MGRKILIIYAHPFPRRSRISHVLKDSVADLEGVRIHELYESYPDFFINVPREQEALRQADIVVFQHPFYWYSCPSLMKEWLDVVLDHSLAIGTDACVLKGKAWMHVISLGGTQALHQMQGEGSFSIKELLRPFEQTARLCRMIPLEPMFVQSARPLEDEEILATTNQYRETLIALRDGQAWPRYSTQSLSIKDDR